MKTPSFKQTVSLVCLASSILLLASCGTKHTTSSSSKKTDETSQTSTTPSTTSASQINSTSQLSQDAPADSSTTTTTTDTPQISYPITIEGIPQDLIGTWTGTSDMATDVTMSVSVDGSITTSADFGWEGTSDIRESQATITQVTQLYENIYRIDSYSGQIDAFLPGIQGLGGVGAVHFGFKLENNQFTSLNFVAATEDEIDYNNPSYFNFSLSRE